MALFLLAGVLLMIRLVRYFILINSMVSLNENKISRVYRSGRNK